VADAIATDPLRRARDQLLALGAPAALADGIDAEARAEIADAVQFAENSPPPEAAAAYADVQTLGAGQWL